MNLKNIITFICLLVLSIQVLPVKQIGFMLFSNQIQEELPHCSDTEKDGKEKSYPLKADFFFSAVFSLSNYFSATHAAYFHFAVSLPSCNAGEIHTPPPNIT